MASISINLKISRENEGLGQRWETLHVSGRPDEPYVALVEQAANELGISTNGGGLPFIDYDDPEFGVRFTLSIAPEISLADVLAIVGEDASASPPTLQAGRAGRGGGGDEPLLPQYVLSYVRLTVEMWGYGTIVLGAWKLGVRRYFLNLRRLSADWVRTGLLDDEVREKVLSRREWTEGELHCVFALSPESNTKLLTELGYEYRSGNSHWVDVRSEEIHNSEPWL